MKLRLSKNNSIRTILSSVSSDSDQGIPLYDIHTPRTLIHRTTTISRISPSAGQGSLSYLDNVSDDTLVSKDNDKLDSMSLGDGAATLAQIHWKTFGSAVLDYKGRSMKINDFMRKNLLGLNRSFEGPDGKRYTWHSGAHLTTGEGTSEVEVARFHDQAVFSRRKAWLEIHEAGMHMVDLVVITWAFALREYKDNMAAAAGAASASSSSAAAVAV